MRSRTLHSYVQAWQSPGSKAIDESSDRVKFEVAQSYQLARDAHQHLKLAHQQLQAATIPTRQDAHHTGACVHTPCTSSYGAFALVHVG